MTVATGRPNRRTPASTESAKTIRSRMEREYLDGQIAAGNRAPDGTKKSKDGKPTS
jgi:hypothetical protein